MARILLVDDEADVLKLYKTALEAAGYSVSTAHNGAQAFDKAAHEKPDLVLMDEKMPVMDGITAQQKMQIDPATKDIKVVFLTAFSDPARAMTEGELLAQSGALGCIRKGVALDELAQKVGEYLKA